MTSFTSETTQTIIDDHLTVVTEVEQVPLDNIVSLRTLYNSKISRAPSKRIDGPPTLSPNLPYNYLPLRIKKSTSAPRSHYYRPTILNLRRSSKFYQNPIIQEIMSSNYNTASSNNHLQTPPPRMERPIRQRVHTICHRCGTTFGRSRTCSGCQHRKCDSCVREPSRRRDPNGGGNGEGEGSQNQGQTWNGQQDTTA